MGEKFEPNEQREVTEEEVIDALKEIKQNGGDTRTCEPYQQFVKQQEAIAKKADTNRVNVERAIVLARIYATAGFLEEALEELEQTREMVTGPENEEIRTVVWQLMDQIEDAMSESPEGE